MSTNSKQSKENKFLLFLSVIIIGGTAIFCFSILWNECSQLITNALIYYNTRMMQNAQQQTMGFDEYMRFKQAKPDVN